MFDEVWSLADINRVYEEKLAEFRRTFGKRPAWWRFTARRHYDSVVERIERLHQGDRDSMAASDVKGRAIIAHLTGWKRS